ncbi:MAG: penicillin-binding protein 2 [Tannerella sp.]|jgi:penicillin-binding protein 2|nr:penicillin-binding protein 2 [Tannerella sp.]
MNNKPKYYYSNRRHVIAGAVLALLFIFVVRLFYLQIMSDDYKKWADSNAFLRRTLYPSRGVIYDRNGKLLVYNQPSYDIMVIMREIVQFDTIDFCNTVGITKDFFDSRMAGIKSNSSYSPYISQMFMSQLSAVEYGVLQEKFYKFPGFYIRNRPLREYGCSNAANVLGNLGEVNRKDLEADDYYAPGDRSGRSGVERSYENILRGEKGVEILLRDAHGRVKGKYENGEHDIAPVSGKNITLSIDMELQAYGEMIMQNKPGAIVMIEPATGEVLCLVSSPSYDPGLLIGRQRGSNYLMLERDVQRPLLDRTIMGSYSPGSTFKPTQGLIFLQEGVVTKEKVYTCELGYPYLGGHPKCHPHYSPISLVPSLATSCNAYYCWGLHDMLDSRSRYGSVQEAFEVWKNYIVAQGFGYPLGVDLPGEQRGYIPNSSAYDKSHNGRWNSSSIISIAIGQGEINATPLQICNLAATIANRGFYIVPHVVSKIQDTEQEEIYRTRKYTGINEEYYGYIVEGMRMAVTSAGGTCGRMYLPNIDVCGKTGTVQNPHGRDHSACIAFAPMNNPKVAIVVYAENGGWGATVSVPVARLMLEKYFYGEIPAGDRWLEYQMQNWSTSPGSINYIKKAKEEENASDGEHEDEHVEVG